MLRDGYFHVYARGIASETPLFADDADRGFFVVNLKRCVRRFHWTCHAYSVLSTHYHLVVESTLPNLSAGAHRLNTLYAQHVNATRSSFGHVFAERFQARVIESEEYLFDACEYVFQNPVAAGLCDAARGLALVVRPLRRLAGGPAVLREEEAVPRAVRAAEADEQREACERPTLPDAAVLEHRRLGVEDGVARARRPRCSRGPWRRRPSRYRTCREAWA